MFICREYRNIARAALSTPSTTHSVGDREVIDDITYAGATMVGPNIGTAEQAIDYALNLIEVDFIQAEEFLRDWHSGDVSAWPSYLEWLSGEGRE